MTARTLPEGDNPEAWVCFYCEDCDEPLWDWEEDWSPPGRRLCVRCANTA